MAGRRCSLPHPGLEQPPWEPERQQAALYIACENAPPAAKTTGQPCGKRGRDLAKLRSITTYEYFQGIIAYPITLTSGRIFGAFGGNKTADKIASISSLRQHRRFKYPEQSQKEAVTRELRCKQVEQTATCTGRAYPAPLPSARSITQNLRKAGAKQRWR